MPIETDALARLAAAGIRGFALAGAGGHGRVVASSAAASGLVACLVLERPGAGTPDRMDLAPALAVPVSAAELPPGDPSAWAMVIGVGVRPTRTDPGTGARRRLHEAFVAAGCRLPAIIDPSAVLRGAVSIGDGAQILAGAVVQTGAVIGAGAVVNTGARIDHDSRIGDHAFIAPGAILCGGVTVGAGAFVGAGAVLLPGAVVADGAVVPAAARIGPAGGQGALRHGGSAGPPGDGRNKRRGGT